MDTQKHIVHVAETSGFADFKELAKLRLSLLVVVTAALGYILANKFYGLPFDLISLLALSVGGFFVTASANGLNQVIEKDFDKLMDRTLNRPLATGRMTVLTALITCTIWGIIGVTLLYLVLNPLTAILGFVSLVLYAFVYTPLKRVSPIAVFIGAFPGAFPPLLGWTAASGELNVVILSLFAIQFFWQFPHFWAIAWQLNDDYNKAGYYLLPTRAGKVKSNAVQTFVYTIVMSIVSYIPIYLGMGNSALALILIITPLNIFFLYKAYRLLQTLSDADAKKLMFASFIYAPLIYILYAIL